MEPDAIVAHGTDLALYLGGGPDQIRFNTDMLRLLASGNGQQRAQLRSAFPHEVLVWEVWEACEDHPTAAQLACKVEEVSAVNLSQLTWAGRQIADLVNAFAPGRW